MSSYTMDIDECLNTLLSLEGIDVTVMSTREMIEEGRKRLFDFDYPIFDPSYKKIFETHFIRNFFKREIGFETEDYFKFQLESWLLINMPYFNKLFESEMIQFDPLMNTKVDVTYKKSNDKKQSTVGSSEESNKVNSNQSTSGDTTDDNFTRTLNSDNPDNRLAITTNDGEGVIQYASSIQETNDNNARKTSANSQVTSDDSTNVNSNVDGEINEIEDFIQSRSGKVGSQSYSKLLNDYRKSFIRVENTIFSEMQQLFMLVYS